MLGIVTNASVAWVPKSYRERQAWTHSYITKQNGNGQDVWKMETGLESLGLGKPQQKQQDLDGSLEKGVGLARAAVGQDALAASDSLLESGSCPGRKGILTWLSPKAEWPWALI